MLIPSFILQERINVHGPTLFCLINALPSLTIVVFLVRELFREDKIFLMPLAQLTIIISPMILHFVATVSMHLASGEANAQGRGTDQEDTSTRPETESV
jgi:hypothetical protein